jgi:hypothetical protein
VRARNKELQDLNLSQISSFSDAHINEMDHIEKLSKIRESLHKASSKYIIRVPYVLRYVYENDKFCLKNQYVSLKWLFCK